MPQPFPCPYILLSQPHCLTSAANAPLSLSAPDTFSAFSRRPEKRSFELGIRDRSNPFPLPPYCPFVYVSRSRYSQGSSSAFRICSRLCTRTAFMTGFRVYFFYSSNIGFILISMKLNDIYDPFSAIRPLPVPGRYKDTDCQNPVRQSCSQTLRLLYRNPRRLSAKTNPI